MKIIKHSPLFLYILIVCLQLIGCKKENSSSPEEKAFVTWAEKTCLTWAETFNRQLDSGNTYRFLPNDCIAFYKLYGSHLPYVANSLIRYENEVVNGDKKYIVHPNMFEAEMALRWQNEMLASIRYPNPLRDAILQAAFANAQRSMNQNSQQNLEAFKLRAPAQNSLPIPTPQVSNPNTQTNTQSTTCTSCSGSGTRNMACFTCKGTGLSIVGTGRYKCQTCAGKGFERCLPCSGTGKNKY